MLGQVVVKLGAFVKIIFELFEGIVSGGELAEHCLAGTSAAGLLAGEFRVTRL